MESDRNDEKEAKTDELDDEADLHGFHTVQGRLIVIGSGVCASHNLGNKCGNVTGNEEWCCCMSLGLHQSLKFAEQLTHVAGRDPKMLDGLKLSGCSMKSNTTLEKHLISIRVTINWK